MQKTTKVLTILFAAALFIATIHLFVPAVAASDGWTVVYDARSLKAYPDVKEYVWQKKATTPPSGEYDKIGLHSSLW